MKLTEFNKTDITNTPAFKEWFGHSIVRNNDETPKIVYHGTNKTFTKFNPALSDIGIHFGSANQANQRIIDRFYTVKGDIYADPVDQEYEYSKGIQILPCYIRIENPVYLDFDLGVFASEGLLYALKDNGYISDLEVAKFISLTSAPIINYQENRKKKIGTLYRKLLKSKGYDGIIYPNEYEGHGDSYIVFSPYQVKSALTNTGNFDPKSKNITEAGVRGPHQDKEFELMLQGKKKAAILTPYEFSRISRHDVRYMRQNGWIIKKVMVYLKGNKDWPWDEFVIGLPGEENRVNKIISLFKQLHSTGFKDMNDYNRDMGKALGYSDEDIDYFINNPINTK